MCENKAKNAFQVREFNMFFREHGMLEQFLRILGVEIEEEKIFVYFTGELSPKMTFRYHSGGVMLTHIFEKVNYFSFR